MSATPKPQNPLLAQLHALKQQVTGQAAQVDALIALAEAQAGNATSRKASADDNPAGNPHTFRRLLKAGRVRAWKEGRHFVCDWAEMQDALRADAYQPKQEPTEDPLEAALAAGDLEASDEH